MGWKCSCALGFSDLEILVAKLSVKIMVKFLKRIQIHNYVSIYKRIKLKIKIFF